MDKKVINKSLAPVSMQQSKTNLSSSQHLFLNNRVEPISEENAESCDSLENYNYPSGLGSGTGDTNANTSTVDSSQKIKKKAWFKKFRLPLFGASKKNQEKQQEHNSNNLFNTTQTLTQSSSEVFKKKLDNLNQQNLKLGQKQTNKMIKSSKNDSKSQPQSSMTTQNANQSDSDPEEDRKRFQQLIADDNKYYANSNLLRSNSPSSGFKIGHKNTVIEESKGFDDRAFRRDLKQKASQHKSYSSRSKQMNKMLEGSFIGQINTTNISPNDRQMGALMTNDYENSLIEEILEKRYNILSAHDRIQLIDKVIEGIPSYLRGKFWLVSTGAQYMNDDPNYVKYYQSLIDDFPAYPNPAFYQIELDLKRTFPEEAYYRKPKNLEKIRRILVAYVKRNPFVGYCQGMNFIVARLIKHLKEEQAFWVFINMIEAMILPLDYYTQTIGVQTDVIIFKDMIKSSLPVIHAKFQELGIDSMFFSLNWFICLYTDKLNEIVSCAILDMLFLIGSHILLNIGIAILYILKEEILKCTNVQQFYTLLYDHQNYIKDPQRLLILACFDQKDLKIMKPSDVYEQRLKLSQEAFNNSQEKRNLMSNTSLTSLIQKQKPSSVQMYQMKQKFYNQFQLFAGLSKLKNCPFYCSKDELFRNLDMSKIEQSGVQSAFLSNAFENNAISEYKCDMEWPICLYDFTFKVIYPQFFCYKVDRNHVIEWNYFDFDNLPRSNDYFNHRATTSYRNNISISDQFAFNNQQMAGNHESVQMEDLMKYSIEDSRFNSLSLRDTYRISSTVIKIETVDFEQQRKEVVKDLLVYRGHHYCDDQIFISKFVELFKMDNRDLIESQEVLSSTFIDTKQSKFIMENYVNLINKVDFQKPHSTSQLRKKSIYDIMQYAKKKSSPLTMQQLIEGKDDSFYEQSPPSQNSFFNKMKSTRVISSSRYTRARKTTNLLNSTYQAHTSILTSGSNEKKKTEKNSLHNNDKKKRPKSQNLVTLDNRQSKSSSQQQKLMAGIQFIEQKEVQLRMLQNNMPGNQFEILKRQTIREIMQKIDPQTLQENMQVFKRTSMLLSLDNE
ncbi:gtpase-activating protein [Stylonychia lemnae]|uniref:Gtpase-activating protein n=1 Tax=Stylonychia lemnae TaxID=5949 RepID=A0A078A682_STYLE|nr:gtpase-activating protein [Stylonychia lemnae]|eukprot:CDW77765.1 gtpase-activating protein [Stylonychia lemnae]